MNIGGLVPFSLCDFPGHVCAVVFTQGCNFRCPFCHNAGLIPMRVPHGGLRGRGTDHLSGRELLSLLRARRGRLSGVVISGGEPTLQSDLIPMLRDLRNESLAVKLDTNGSRPEVLQRVIEEDLADFIAMDIKAPFHKYELLAGVPVRVDTIRRSLALLSHSGIRHQFRTTWVKPLLSPADIGEIAALVPAGSDYALQEFRADLAWEAGLRVTAFSDKKPGERREQAPLPRP